MANILAISNYRSEHSHRPEAHIFVGLRKLGHSVTVITYPQSPFREEFATVGIRLIEKHPTQKKDLPFRRYLSQLLEEEQFDGIFLYNNLSIANGIPAAKNRPGKVILYRGCPGNIHWWDPTSYFKHLHPRVDYIICNSQAVKQHLQDALLWRSSKAITIPKGQDDQWYREITPYSRDRFPGSPNGFKIVFIGNDRRVKGVKYLLKSTQWMAEDPDIELYLFGKGLRQNRYQRQIEKSPISKRIYNMGFRRDAIQYLAAADALILPSIEQESLTKVLFEAICLGIPTIATDIPGNQELLQDKRTSLVVPPKDAKAIGQAVHQLKGNPQLQEKIAKKALQHVRSELSHDQTVEKYHAFIETHL